MIFNATDYAKLHALVFSEGYPGYRPALRERFQDSGKTDQDKRFAHVATKYLAKDPDLSRAAALEKYLLTAHCLAINIAKNLCLPERLWPALEACALRVLDYQPGATTAPHYDFNLFSVNCYRDRPEQLRPNRDLYHLGELAQIFGVGPQLKHWTEPCDAPTQSIIYFALPAHDVTMTVGEWVQWRVETSRVKA